MHDFANLSIVLMAGMGRLVRLFILKCNVSKNMAGVGIPAISSKNMAGKGYPVHHQKVGRYDPFPAISSE